MFFAGREILKKVVFIICFAVSPIGTAWASDYQQGLSAYVDGNFELAQKHWMAAAKAKHARSMFNLGLLHEQYKLPTSSNDDAIAWYRSAADNGYTPAGYHLAQRMIERGGSDDEAIGLIKRAADQGYAPALRYLGLSQGSTAGADYEGAFEPPGLGYQTESWINQQAGMHWTIQLLAFTQKEHVLEFIEDNHLQAKTAYFSEVQNGDVFYKLVYGSFKSKDKASFARQNLSPALQQHGPWLRTWDSVQKITK